jgi:hypothetical protein
VHARRLKKMGLDAVEAGHLRVINDFLGGIYKSRQENSAQDQLPKLRV